jgi:hypothetical protein
MPWVRFDDRFPSNRKVRLLSDRAFRLYVSAICWSAENLTDGFIGESELRLVADVRGAKTAAVELVERGLWVPSERVRAAAVLSSSRVHDVNSSRSRRGGDAERDAPDDTKVRGWEIHDYHEYNPTAEQVRADRAAKTARQQRWRDKHKGDAPPPEPPGNQPDVDASTDTSRNASRDGAGDGAPRARIPDPTRPDPSVVSGEGRERADRSSAREPQQPLSLITPDWQPSSDDRAAASADLTRLGTKATTSATTKFIRHQQARGTRLADFGPAWVTWLARERVEQQGAFLVGLPGGGAPTPTPPSYAQRMAELDAAAARDDQDAG